MANAVQSQNPPKRKPNQTDLLDLLVYDPASGMLTWKDRSGPWVRKGGSKAGSIRKDGYVHVGVWRKQYYAHCIIWCMVTGEWPTTQVDHKNLVRSDNAWKNLRLATPSQNRANIGALNTLKAKGITREASGRYRARICVRGKHRTLGTFNCIDDAKMAYARFAKGLYGEFARVE